MRFDIVKGEYQSRGKVISVNRLENFYVELEDAEKSKTPKALINSPGYRLVSTVYNTGFCRAMYSTSNDRMFVIINNRLFEMDAGEVFTERGVVSTVVGICRIADNGNELIIVDGSNGYLFNLSTNTLSIITDTDFPSSPTHCIFTDGYFIVNDAGTGRFYWSDLYDGSTWDSLNFATAEYSSDNIQGIVKISNGTLWFVGKYSTELWQNTGNADLPWRRIQGAVKEVGSVAPYSIVTNKDQLFFLSYNDSIAVYMGSGYDLVRISTPAIEYQIKQFIDADQAIGFTYKDEGHSFYVLSFTTQGTIVYDVSTGQWHRRGTFNAATGDNSRQQAQGYAFFNSKHYTGSYLNGKVFEMTLDTYTEDSDSIKRVIETSHLASEHRLLKHKKFEIEFERGVGLVGGEVPQIMLQFSDDGGNTFSNEIWNSAGEIGEFKTRARWHRLGASRDRVYKLAMSTSVKWIIVDAYIVVN